MSRIILKSKDEIEVMAEAGKTLAECLFTLLDAAKPGVSTIELDEMAERLVAQHGVRAAFKGFEGYPFSLVTCLNEEVVHGFPSECVLKDGDCLTLDFGVLHKGYYSDMARTKIVGKSDPKLDAFVQVGERAVLSAIDQCKVGSRIGDLSAAMQSVVEGSGNYVVRAFVGHGVGRDLHEEPQIPGVGVRGSGPEIKEGMVLAVEVMYAKGTYEVEILDDGWTAVTADGSISGMFENTVAVLADGPQILTSR